jgi:hypothetical protein
MLPLRPFVRQPQGLNHSVTPARESHLPASSIRGWRNKHGGG